MTAALFLLLAAFSRVDVIDQTFQILGHDWRYVDRPVNHDPATIFCTFQADAPRADVRVVLLTRSDLDAWLQGRVHDEIAATPAGPGGTLRVTLHEPDAYLAIENRGSLPARVRLRVFLEQPEVRYLSRGRQLAVILISFGVFFAMVTFSARKLLRSIRR